MAKIINGSYRVCDCEHWGDVQRDENYLRDNGCKVVSHYWDGHDCGEAYIEFTCNEQDFPRLYKKFCGSAHFDADINDYVQADGLKGYKRMSRKELYEIKKQMDNDLTPGFQERLALLLWFEVMERKDYTTDEIVEQCLKFLKDVEVIGYETHVTDGKDWISILIRSSYKNLTKERIGAVGDYCLGSSGWLDWHHIYGECRCSHVFLSKHVMWYYSLLQDVMQRVLERKPLEYRAGSFYYPKDRTMTADEYLTEDGTLRNEIEIDGLTYRLRDPRSWVGKSV